MNTVESQRNARNYCTVAELVARERAAYTPYRRPRQENRERRLQPVTELLRREGIEFDGEDTPTIEMPTTKIHASQVLRRETAPPESETRAGKQADKRRGGKLSAISGAAVLCGLTVAGLIALKPTVASGPANTLAGAGAGDGTTSTTAVGGVKPTSTVVQRADTTHGVSGGGAASQQPSGGVGGGVRATQQPSEPATVQAGPSRTVAPVPAEDSEPTSRQSPPPSDDDDNNDNDGGLIEDTTKTVTDTVGKVTEPVEDTVDPVTGSISGTLDGVLG